MAVYGVGIDLVRTPRIERMLERWDEKFTARVFFPQERETCRRRAHPAPCFAMRFAAKEAFVKALGMGIRPPISWLDIEIRSNALGKPEIHLSPRALDYCRQQGIRSWHVSLTDDGEYGAAVVILET